MPGIRLGRFCLWTARGLAQNEIKEGVDMGKKLTFIDRLKKNPETIKREVPYEGCPPTDPGSSKRDISPVKKDL